MLVTRRPWMGGSNQTADVGFERRIFIKKTLIILLLCLPFFTGCGTLCARTPWRNEISDIPRFYPATYFDGCLLIAPCNPNNEAWGSFPRRLGIWCIGLVDLPFSLVTDTLCFPLDIWAYEPRK